MRHYKLNITLVKIYTNVYYRAPIILLLRYGENYLKKFLYIINPVAGNGKGERSIEIIDSYCKSNKIDFQIYVTEYPLHATEIAKENSMNFSHIIAVGGDGTVNEVLNGISLRNNIIFAALPVGTGNDLVKNFNYPTEILDILEIIHSEEKQEIKSIDIGKVNYTTGNSNEIKEHLFINNLGIGFDAYVGYLNQHHKLLKGVTSYVVAVFKALINYQMINSIISFNDIQISGHKLMLTVGNGISSGGGFYLTPKALIDDNLLDISIFEQISRFRLLNVLPKALVNKLETVKEASMYKSKKIDIVLKEPYFVHCDGEIITKQIKTAKIICLPKALKIITKK